MQQQKVVSSNSRYINRFRINARYELWLKEFKFFPAEANGGVKALKAIAGPFSQVKFCPTGGISPANYRDYLALKSVLCIGGSWLVPEDALESGDYQRITQLAEEAIKGAQQ